MASNHRPPLMLLLWLFFTRSIEIRKSIDNWRWRYKETAFLLLLLFWFAQNASRQLSFRIILSEYTFIHIETNKHSFKVDIQYFQNTNFNAIFKSIKTMIEILKAIKFQVKNNLYQYLWKKNSRFFIEICSDDCSFSFSLPKIIYTLSLENRLKAMFRSMACFFFKKLISLYA